MHIQAAILLVLTGRPAHGQAILGRLRKCAGVAGECLRVAEGGVYEHLHALEREGLAIKALPSRVEKRRGRPPVLYALTQEGKLRAREHRLFLQKLLKVAPEEEGT